MKTKSIKPLKNSDSKDFWDELSKKQKALIDAAIKDADEGKITGHDTIMKMLWEKQL